MSVISVSNLTKNYQSHQKEPGFGGSMKSLFFRKYETIRAVNDISFEIKEGELVGFIGPNGAGKTTTLKCLSGLLYPTNGKISVLGFTPYQRRNEFLKKISLVMGQKNQLLWDLPAIDTILLNKEIYDIENKEFEKNLGELSELLEIRNLLNFQVKKLSLGQRMKMELLASLIHTPKILFLDEPTIGLDVVMQKKLRDFIKEYNSRHKATIILTSHYMEDVEALCKRVIIINDGKIIYDGLLSSLTDKYAPYKLIRIILAAPIDKEKLSKLGRIKEYNYPELILLASDREAKKIAPYILKTLKVKDFNIENQNIEDVIREVFISRK